MLSWFKRKEDPKQQLREVLGDHELPSFPAIVLEALGLLRQPEGSLSDVADILSSDPGVTVKLLGVSNSAGFALSREVTSVRHAVALLGRSSVESLLLSFAVSGALATRSPVPRSFWNEAAYRAVLARALAQRLHPVTHSESFTAGLLQNMSVPLLTTVYGAEYEKLCAQAAAGEASLSSLEREKYGWDHAHVAGWMCKEWGFPEPLMNAIGSHHESDAPGVPLSVCLVADFVQGDAQAIESLVESVHASHGVSRDELLALLAEAEEASGEVAALFAA